MDRLALLGSDDARRTVCYRARHRWRRFSLLWIISMTIEDIKRTYDNHPMLTLKELSAITGLTVATLKRLLLS
jgi:hypothetical protein